MRLRYAVLALVTVAVLAVAPAAAADQPAAGTFVAVLNAAEEVPTCAPATDAARGLAVLHVRDAAAGTVEFTLIANNLPGEILAAHIHIGPTGVAGTVVQALPPTPGAENGMVGEGSFTNPDLVAAIQADPDNYYVNVHTGPPGVGCPAGVIRGQLDQHGPLNN